jgi:hypothetical protein
LQHSIVGEDDGALDDVLEFTYVPRPRIAGQRRQRLCGDGGDGFMQVLRVLLGEVSRQKGNILGPFA